MYVIMKQIQVISTKYSWDNIIKNWPQQNILFPEMQELVISYILICSNLCEICDNNFPNKLKIIILLPYI